MAITRVMDILGRAQAEQSCSDSIGALRAGDRLEVNPPQGGFFVATVIAPKRPADESVVWVSIGGVQTDFNKSWLTDLIGSGRLKIIPKDVKEEPTRPLKSDISAWCNGFHDYSRLRETSAPGLFVPDLTKPKYELTRKEAPTQEIHPQENHDEVSAKWHIEAGECDKCGTLLFYSRKGDSCPFCEFAEIKSLIVK